MKRCVLCGEMFESGAGLASHRRAKHGRVRGENRRAAEDMLAILRDLGRIEDIDAARVQTIRSLADALDADPSNAQMWRTYREAVEDMMGTNDDGDQIDELVAEINRRAEVGNIPET